MSEPSPLVGPLQIRVLEFLWEGGVPMTVHQIHKGLNAKEGAPQLAYTTILTVLRNLSRRGIVSQKPVARGHVFAPLLTWGEYQRRVATYVCNTFFSGNASAYALAIRSVE